MKRYLIAALALALIAVSVVHAQTRFIPIADFKPDRIAIHQKVDSAKMHRCRGHAVPFKYAAWKVPVRLRPAALSFWRGRLRIVRAMSSRCSVVPAWIANAFLCIKSHEGAWTSNTGNGYYGGLQMDMSFQATYGGALLASKGTANNWTPSEQIYVGYTAWKTRGFYPWPNTARYCGLL